MRGLEAGADDFLTKPVNELALFARVRSLVRLKMMMDEWRLREETCGQFELMSAEAASENDNGNSGQVLLAESSAAASAKICDTLSGHGHKTTVATSAAEALALSKQIASTSSSSASRSATTTACASSPRCARRTKPAEVPILLVVDEFDTPRLIKGLDIGASDYLVKPIDRNELIARVRTRSAGAVIRTACAPTTSAACRWRSPIR